LEHEAQIGATIPSELAGARLGQPGDQPQYRTLAAARGAEQADELAGADGEADILQRGSAIGEALADIVERDDREQGGLLLRNRPVMRRRRDRRLAQARSPPQPITAPETHLATTRRQFATIAKNLHKFCTIYQCGNVYRVPFHWRPRYLVAQ
jgi:hypothetical protein